MPDLWHYTCEHSAPEIIRTGTLLPAVELSPTAQLAWPGELVWLTDLRTPHPPAALGLDPRRQTRTRCDRTAYRFRVLEAAAGVWWWPAYRRRHRPPGAHLLESSPGCRPVHWWVSTEPVPVLLEQLDEQPFE